MAEDAGLLLLSDELLRFTWPPDHVVAGLAVCRRLSSELRKAGAQVRLHANQRKCKGSFRHHVKMLKSFSCSVEFHSTQGTAPIDVITAAVHEKWCGPEVLNLSRARGSPQSDEQDDAALRHHALMDVGAIQLASVLPQCEHLKYLDLSCNLLGIKSFMKLATGLSYCLNLTHLNLHGNRLCPASARMLARALPSCPLQHLDLSVDPAWVAGANQTHAGTIPLLCAVIPRCSALTTLALSGHLCGVDGASSLADALPACSQLSHLDLASNTLGNEGMRLLGLGLCRCEALQTLDLSLNELEIEGGRALAEVLPCLPHLAHLRLRANGIEDDGCTRIAHALPRCGSLESLDLTTNGIEAAGIAPLTLAMPECTRLRSLVLACNLLDAPAAALLAPALPASPSLRFLSLRGNEIGDVGAGSVAAALPQCALTSLDLSNNEIGDKGASKLAVAASKASVLRALSLGGNAFGPEARARLWRSAPPLLDMPGLPPPPGPRGPLLEELRCLFRRLREGHGQTAAAADDADV